MEIPKNSTQWRDLASRIGETAGGAATQLRPLMTATRNMALTGVVVAIPLLATLWVVKLAYVTINDISEPILLNLGIKIPLLPFFVTLVLFIGIGFMASNVFGRRLLEKGELALLRIPVVATLYSAIKQVIDSFKSFKNVQNFKRVVYIDYPAEGAHLIGFVTGQYYDSKLGEEMTSVIIPTTPAPTTGLLVVVPSHRLTESSLTLEEAMKMVVSAGLVAPKRCAVAPVSSEALDS